MPTQSLLLQEEDQLIRRKGSKIIFSTSLPFSLKLSALADRPLSPRYSDTIYGSRLEIDVSTWDAVVLPVLQANKLTPLPRGGLDGKSISTTPQSFPKAWSKIVDCLSFAAIHSGSVGLAVHDLLRLSMSLIGRLNDHLNLAIGHWKMIHGQFEAAVDPAGGNKLFASLSPKVPQALRMILAVSVADTADPTRIIHGESIFGYSLAIQHPDRNPQVLFSDAQLPADLFDHLPSNVKKQCVEATIEMMTSYHNRGRFPGITGHQWAEVMAYLRHEFKRP